MLRRFWHATLSKGEGSPVRELRWSGRTHPDGEGERQCDGERQSFWNSDDEDRHADDDRVDIVLDVRHAPRALIDGEFLDREADD